MSEVNLVPFFLADDVAVVIPNNHFDTGHRAPYADLGTLHLSASPLSTNNLEVEKFSLR